MLTISWTVILISPSCWSSWWTWLFFAHLSFFFCLFQSILEIHNFHFKLVVIFVLFSYLFFVPLVLHGKLLIGMLLLSQQSLQFSNRRFFTFISKTMRWIVVHFGNSAELGVSLGICDSLGNSLATFADNTGSFHQIHDIVNLWYFSLAWSRRCFAEWSVKWIQFSWEICVLFDHFTFRGRNREYVLLSLIQIKRYISSMINRTEAFLRIFAAHIWKLNAWLLYSILWLAWDSSLSLWGSRIWRSLSKESLGNDWRVHHLSVFGRRLSIRIKEFLILLHTWQ